MLPPKSLVDISCCPTYPNLHPIESSHASRQARLPFYWMAVSTVHCVLGPSEFGLYSHSIRKKQKCREHKHLRFIVSTPRHFYALLLNYLPLLLPLCPPSRLPEINGLHHLIHASEPILIKTRFFLHPVLFNFKS